MTIPESYLYGLVTGVVVTAFGVLLHFLITEVKDRHQRRLTIAAVEQQLKEEAQLNIAKLGQLSSTTERMLEGGIVPVFEPFRMSLATLHQARSANELRLLPRTTQWRWWAIAEECESFNGFLANTELLATICLLHTNGLQIVRFRHQQLAQQAKETEQSIESWLDKIASSKQS